MDCLLDWYTPLGIEDVIRYARGERLDRDSCWVTFDDGDPSVIDVALPILRERSIRATLFVCPRLIDTSDPFWWQVVEEASHLGIQLKGSETPYGVRDLKKVADPIRRKIVEELRDLLEQRAGRPLERRQLTTDGLRRWLAAGNSIGNHTWDHPLLDMCEPFEQKRQISLAHDWLIQRVGSVSAFAYPNGNHTNVAERTLKELGYASAALFDHRIATQESGLRMSRIRVNASDEVAQFRAKISGLHPYIHGLIGRQ